MGAAQELDFPLLFTFNCLTRASGQSRLEAGFTTGLRLSDELEF